MGLLHTAGRKGRKHTPPPGSARAQIQGCTCRLPANGTPQHMWARMADERCPLHFVRPPSKKKQLKFLDGAEPTMAIQQPPPPTWAVEPPLWESPPSTTEVQWFTGTSTLDSPVFTQSAINHALDEAANEGPQ